MAERRKAILVVESEPVCQTFLVHALHASGYSVIEAATGSEAVAICRAPPSPLLLVIVDSDLPDGDGVEVARQIRQHCPDVPILLTSAIPLEGWSQKSTATLAGLPSLVDFLAKPFQVGALHTKIDKLIGASA